MHLCYKFFEINYSLHIIFLFAIFFYVNLLIGLQYSKEKYIE